MPTGISLHIGLNGVDASKYNGWPGTLQGCVNDANAMESICRTQGFSTQLLLNSNAVADAILAAIGQAAASLSSGDTFVISYSGHGGQVPDTTGSSPNGLDDTWVAYDRMILGHELYNLWSQFSPDVRIEVFSDSCHSGTVIRELFMPNGSAKSFPPQRRGVASFRRALGNQNLQRVYGPAIKATPDLAIASNQSRSASNTIRAVPPAVALFVFERDRTAYEAAQWSRSRADISASVILISACQDNQVAQDGGSNGLFTENLLRVWDHGSFSGSLPQFCQAIIALMPSSQTPNYFTEGVQDFTFMNARPLTIVSGATHVSTGGASVLSQVEALTNTTSSSEQIQEFLSWVQAYPAGRAISLYIGARQSGILGLLQSFGSFRTALEQVLRVFADLGPKLTAGADATVPDEVWPSVEVVIQAVTSV